MSTSSSDSIFGLGTTQVIVPIGATLAVLVTGLPAQNALLLKLQSGGTLEIIGLGSTFSPGATLTPAQLATASGNHYIVGASEILSIDGPASFYLSSTGATSKVCMIVGKTQA